MMASSSSSGKTENESGHHHDVVFVAHLPRPCVRPPRCRPSRPRSGSSWTRSRSPGRWTLIPAWDILRTISSLRDDRDAVGLDHQFSFRYLRAMMASQSSMTRSGSSTRLSSVTKTQRVLRLVIDVIQVGQDALDGECPERPPVHVIHAAEVAGPGAAPGGLHDLDLGIHDVVTPGQPPLVPDGQLQPGKIQKLAPRVVNETPVLLVGERRDLLETILAVQGIDQPPARLLAFPPDHEVDQPGLLGGGNLLVHQGGMVAADDDLRLRAAGA